MLRGQSRLTRQFLHKGRKPVGLEQLCQLGTVRRSIKKIIKRVVDRNMVIGCSKPLRKSRLIGKLLQTFTVFPFHFSGPLEQRIKRTELLDQFYCGLFADAWDSGNIVRSVTSKTENVDHS